MEREARREVRERAGPGSRAALQGVWGLGLSLREGWEVPGGSERGRTGPDGCDRISLTTVVGRGGRGSVGAGRLVRSPGHLR